MDTTDSTIQSMCIPNLTNEIGDIVRGIIGPIGQDVQKLKEQITCTNNDLESSVLSASCFGTHVDKEGTKIEDWFSDSVNLEKYCLDRLREIRAINAYSHTPAAFSCIFSFIGFLSQFAGTDNEESHGYRDFTVKYMRTLKCCVEPMSLPLGTSLIERKWVAGKSLGDPNLFNTWGEILYSLGRCGLVHSLSLVGNRDLRQNQVNLFLTHRDIDSSVIQLFAKDTNGGEIPGLVISSSTEVKRITINADDLCDAVYDGIIRMFQAEEVISRAQQIEQSRPAIMPVADFKEKSK